MASAALRAGGSSGRQKTRQGRREKDQRTTAQSGFYIAGDSGPSGQSCLLLAGHEARIDHRTLEAQGIDRVPTTHLGPSVAAMERKGIRTTVRGNRNRQREDAVEERT